MNEFELLKQRIEYLEGLVNKLIFTDHFLFDKTIEIQDGINLKMSGITGTQIGTNTKQKIGFFGAPPIIQPVSPTFPSGGATVDSQARASINQIINTFSQASTGLGLTA